MRAGHNVTTDGPPRAGSTELAGRIWPAGRTLPTPGLQHSATLANLCGETRTHIIVN